MNGAECASKLSPVAICQLHIKAILSFNVRIQDDCILTKIGPVLLGCCFQGDKDRINSAFLKEQRHAHDNFVEVFS